MFQQIFLCKLADLETTGAFNVLVKANGKELDLVIVRVNDGTKKTDQITAPVRGYKNSCPHRHTPLETFMHEVLDREDPSLLVCSTHGARFLASDGLCVSGPCIGQALTSVNLTIRQDEIFLTGIPS